MDQGPKEQGSLLRMAEPANRYCQWSVVTGQTANRNQELPMAEQILPQNHPPPISLFSLRLTLLPLSLHRSS